MMRRNGVRAWLALAAVLVCESALPAGAQESEKLRPDDTVNITVADQPGLTRKYTIEADGSVVFPFLGRVEAAGLAASQLAGELRRRLNDGFLTDPQVRVDVERTSRVFVFGGVSAPGMYPLTPNMTLIEVLARAGYLGASEVIIVRGNDLRAPAMPDEQGATVIRANLLEFEQELQSGRLHRNVLLADGDTIHVPRFDPNRVYVSGQVRNAGGYSVPEKTTVLQALALAGGPTERAALGRVQIIRLVNGKQQTIKARLEDLVRVGDTIIVPERYF